MAGKARVHELAKELGVTSKEVLARLSDQGEFVKSASSTVEAPVARRLREAFGGAKPAAEKVTADGNGSPAGHRPSRAAKAAPAKPRRTQARSARRARGPAPPPAARSRRPRRPPPAAPAAAPAAARPPSRRNARSAARPGTQARRACPARRQQPVLLADSRSSGRLRVRRHPVRAPRGPGLRAPACRRAICLRVRPAPGPAPRRRSSRRTSSRSRRPRSRWSRWRWRRSSRRSRWRRWWR